MSEIQIKSMYIQFCYYFGWTIYHHSNLIEVIINKNKLTLHAPHPQKPKENPWFFMRFAMSIISLTNMGQNTQKIVMIALLGWPFLKRISFYESSVITESIELFTYLK